MLALRLESKIEERPADLAKRTGRIKSHYARMAILEFLDEEEDYRIAPARLERERPGIPLQEVERIPGLDG